MEKIGEQIWFFPSPVTPNPAHCLLLAHGGWSAACGHFTVQANTTVHFFVADGSVLEGGFSFYEASHMQQHLPNEDVAAGGNCKNYALFKGLGKRSPSKNWAVTYSEVRRELADALDDLDRVAKGLSKSISPTGHVRWCPNFISVRHRAVHSKQILLEDLIDAVQAAKPHITDFYIAACRA